MTLSTKNYIFNYDKLVEAVNIFQRKYDDAIDSMKNALTCEERIRCSRQAKMYKKMRDLLFHPDKAYRWISKHEEVDANQQEASFGVTNDSFKYCLAASHFSGKACSSQIANARPSL